MDGRRRRDETIISVWECPVAYLVGLPILDYSLDIGKEHVNLLNEGLQKLIYSGQLDDKELDRYRDFHALTFFF